MAWEIHDTVAARARDAALVVDDEGVHTAGEVRHPRADRGGRDPRRRRRAPDGRRRGAKRLARRSRSPSRSPSSTGRSRCCPRAWAATRPRRRSRTSTPMSWSRPRPRPRRGRPRRPTRHASGDWRLIARDGERGDARERWGDGVVIGLTSGSTGRAKAVVQTEASLRYAVDSLVDVVGLAAGDAVAAVSPLSSGPAFCFGPYVALRIASPLVLIRALGRRRPCPTCSARRPCAGSWASRRTSSSSQRPPRRRDLACLRAISVGGGPMTLATMRDAERALGTRVHADVRHDRVPRPHLRVARDADEIRLGTEGRAFPGTEHLVLDGSGSEVPRGEAGEAFVRGPSLLLGYARRGRLEPPPLLPSGHFATGDLVRVSPDGVVTVTGRTKNQIMRAGKGIDAVEVETALMQHPAVAEACVVAVPEPTLGEQAAALVVAAEDELLDTATCSRSSPARHVEAQVARALRRLRRAAEDRHGQARPRPGGRAGARARRDVLHHHRHEALTMDFAYDDTTEDAARRSSTRSWTSTSTRTSRLARAGRGAGEPVGDAADHGGAEGRGAQPRAVEPLPPRHARARRRADEPPVRAAVRGHGPQPVDRARGVQLLGARHRQHGAAVAVRHRRAEGRAGSIRCSRARSARPSR